MKNTRKRHFLTTASAVALMFATHSGSWGADIPATPVAPAAVEAADIWVAIEGRYNMYETDIFGSTFFPAWGTDPDNGWGGGLEVGARPAGSNIDFVLSINYDRGNDDTTPYGNSYYNSSEVTEQHIVADFEVGRHMNIGMGGTRIHGGIRFAHFDAEMDGSYYSYGYPYGVVNFGYNQETTVIGPRIGIDQNIPFGENWAVDLSAAGSVLFGRNDRNEYCEGYFGPCSYGNGDRSATVWNAEGSAALSYLFDSGAFQLGWRVDAFWDVFEPGINPTGDKDLITHGPYAKFKYYLSGGPK